MPLDWNSAALAEGLHCYRTSEFFLAHEHWESIWLQLREPEKSFLQALIQTSAAFHHLNSGNPAGTISLLRRALHRFDLCPASFGGLALDPLRAEVRRWLQALESNSRPLPDTFPPINPTCRE